MGGGRGRNHHRDQLWQIVGVRSDRTDLPQPSQTTLHNTKRRDRCGIRSENVRAETHGVTSVRERQGEFFLCPPPFRTDDQGHTFRQESRKRYMRQCRCLSAFGQDECACSCPGRKEMARILGAPTHAVPAIALTVELPRSRSAASGIPARQFVRHAVLRRHVGLPAAESSARPTRWLSVQPNPYGRL